MRKQVYIFNGKLIYNEDAQYEIQSPGNGNGGRVYNLSEILSKIYYADNSYIEIKIMHGCKLLFDEQGNLGRRKSECGLYDYYVDSEPLEEVLFYNTDKDLEITLYADALERDYHDGISEVFNRQR